MSFAQGLEIMASIVFLGYLLWAAWQDVKEMQVVRYTHVAGLLAVVLQAILNRKLIMQSVQAYIIAIVILLAIQITAKWLDLYGVADMIAFFLIGLYFLFRVGVRHYLLTYFFTQALSGILLLAVQVWKHNVKSLKLRHSVPYIPYISVAFGLTNMVL